MSKICWELLCSGVTYLKQHDLGLDTVFFSILFDLILYITVNNISVTSGQVFLGWTSSKLGLDNVSCSKTQRSDASDARTHGPSVSSQALYHWATALPIFECKIANVFLPISLIVCFGCSKLSSHWDISFECPQCMFWSRNKENTFSIHTQLKSWVWSQFEMKPNLQSFSWDCVTEKYFFYISYMS